MAGAGMLKVGPWGASGGYCCDIDPATKPLRLESITVYSSNLPVGHISGFSFVYVDEQGEAIHVGPWGTTNGEEQFFSMSPGDYVNNISGTFDDGGVTSLKFITNQEHVHGPYGWASGTVFSVPLPNRSTEDGNDEHNGGAVVAFFGRKGDSLFALGVYVLGKNGPVKVGPWGGYGGVPVDIPPNGHLKEVTVCSTQERIHGISYTWGTTFIPGNTFYLSQGEYVNDISGTFDDKGVTSLTFTTNQEHVHGPYGRHSGTEFRVALPDNGAVVGFFGFGEESLVAIGVYVGLAPNPEP